MTSNISHKSVLIVSNENTAITMGSGDLPVLATPALAALMENAAMIAARQTCGEGETTVGASIDVKHLLPSPIGARISATAVVQERDGRKLTFIISANENKKLVGTAIHIRYIVNKEKFMSKI